MNDKQKKCLWAGIALIVAMGLFPPWVCERETKIAFGHGEWKSITEPGPYSWIGDPPGKINSQGYLYIRPKFVDLYRLGIQYFVVSVVTAGLIITLRDKKGGKIFKDITTAEEKPETKPFDCGLDTETYDDKLVATLNKIGADFQARIEKLEKS